MDMDFVGWVSLLDRSYPQLDPFIKTVVPALLLFFGMCSAVSKILPTPNTTYPVPDTTSLQKNLGDVKPTFVVRMANGIRKMAILTNWLLATSLYAAFYKLLTGIGGLAGKLNVFKSSSTPSITVPSKSLVTPKIDDKTQKKS